MYKYIQIKQGITVHMVMGCYLNIYIYIYIYIYMLNCCECIHPPSKMFEGKYKDGSFLQFYRL